MRGNLLISIYLFLLHLYTILAVKSVDEYDNTVIVNSTSGLVRGIQVESDISTYIAFYNVPYATPPVGKLRFRLPLPVEHWQGIHDSTKPGPVCIQPPIASLSSSEDCLTLNIFTSNVDDKIKPVFVYIPSGGLEISVQEILGPDYFITYDVMVIIVQSRLGMLGYLNLGLEDAPGNMGMADIIQALNWIKLNIKSFGGDPDQVTLGGVSSGGILTHALLLSPEAEGLFNKVIIQSGTALSYRFYHDDIQIQIDIDNTKAALGMYNESNQNILEKLKHLSPDELLWIFKSIKNKYPTDYAEFHPYVLSKDYFGIIPESPLELMKNNKYPHLPMIIGTTDNEGLRLANSRLQFINDNFHIVVPTDLYPIDEASKEKLLAANAIKYYYFGRKEVNEDTFPVLAQLCTDSWYGIITDVVVKLATYKRYRAPIFYYQFAVDGAYNVAKLASQINKPGASHSDDIGYLFNVPDSRNFHRVFGLDEQKDISDLTTDRMVYMWTNFITYGTPTPIVNELVPLNWDPVSNSGKNFLLINNTLTMENDPMGDRGQFWINLYGLNDILS